MKSPPGTGSRVLRAVGVPVGGCVALALSACASEAQSPVEVTIGPDAISVVDIESPRVLYRVGDSDGPGMVEQGQAVQMAPVPDGGFLMFTHYYGTTGQIQHWRDGELVRTFGRMGQGPGEYSHINGLTVDPRTGDVWVLDAGGRLVSYSATGEPGRTISTREVGASLRSPQVLPDGSLIVNGPGGTAATFGYLIHRYDFEAEAWSAHYPALRGEEFHLMDRRFMLSLAVTPEGKVVVLNSEYEIEILDPDRDFAVEARIRRRPPGWPPGSILEDRRRRAEEDPITPFFSASGAWVDADNRLWVRAGEPEEDWERKVAPDPRRPWEERSLAAALDVGRDTLIEVFDLSSLEIVASVRFDPRIRFVVGPGMLAHYLGDLPHPRFEIIQLNLDQEER